MSAIRMFCKDCDEDMIEVDAESGGTLETIYFQCPICNREVILEIEVDKYERGDDAWQ